MAALTLDLKFRVVPAPRKAFDLPAIKDAAEAASATGAILSAVASGPIKHGEAAEVAKLVETFVMAFVIAD
ncbi:MULTISPECIES: hypothetical protein [Bradyrhizobium]|uniref:hypothetical protein n=1 Tax=Bradyrhizobium TaxID=374 RepID=UPI0003F54778|nr:MULTISPECIES: hypothetical protein [Bradyrhizobium]UFW51511.1 hypothetical protein BaraCB756_11285 [Bradyrhizobium arachidis]